RKKRKSTRRRSSKDVKDAKAEKEEKEKQKLFEKKGVKGLARLLMSLRSVRVNYSISEGTLLPGYDEEASYFGLNDGFGAPGWPFLFGSQSPDIKSKAATNEWLVQNGQLSTTFQQSRAIDLKINAQIEPVKDLRIKVDFKKTKTAGFQELFRYNGDTEEFAGLTPTRTGGYSISYLPIKTAFGNDGISSDVFKEFEENLVVLKRRLDGANPNNGEYNIKSQDVMIPAFIAAYTGQSGTDVDLSPYPEIPRPNWSVNYTGLKRIPALKKLFSSFTISHAYSSIYRMDSYTNSLQYTEGVDLTNPVEDYPFPDRVDESSEFIPRYVINQVTIAERFQPLIGLNIRTKSKITAKLAYNRSRTVGLAITNGQVNEQNDQDVSFDIGYTKAGLKLPFRINGRTVVLKNDLTFRVNFRVKDTQTVQRRIGELDQITNGYTSYQISPTIAYKLNDSLNITAYFKSDVNTPKISTSYKRKTTSFGIQVRYSLTQ
ncbi:MAG: cell surface protein SprA, partial [Cytophagales bacterium]|nr:cell surface protein SprA [Cytophagales bacterium]